MPQLLLQRLPCRDCAGERAWGWRGGEGSLYWCACVLGCCQPKSRHLGKVRSERFHMNVLCPELPPPSSLGHLLPPLVQTLCRLCQSSLEHVEGLKGVHISKPRLKKLNFYGNGLALFLYNRTWGSRDARTTTLSSPEM